MRFGESNKWLRKGVEQLRDDDLLDLYDQMLDDGEEHSRYGVALVDEVRIRWLKANERVSELETAVLDAQRQAEPYDNGQIIIDEMEAMIDDFSSATGVSRSTAAENIHNIATVMLEDAQYGESR
jgi:hypothetical protein